MITISLPKLQNKIKQIKVDKYFNLLRNLKFQLEVYNNKHTILSYGLKKEIFKKFKYVARKITRSVKHKKLYETFVTKHRNIKENLNNFTDLLTMYDDLLNLFEKCKKVIITKEEKETSYEQNVKNYHKQLFDYSKSNFALSQKNRDIKILNRREFFSGYLFTTPALIFISIFVLYSVFYAIWTSLNIVKLKGAGFMWEFVGFDQFIDVAQSEEFKKSLVTSLTYMGMVAPLQTIIALVLSSVLASKIKGNKIFLVIYFLPTLTSSTALTMIFVRLAGSGGPLEQIFGADFAKKNILGLISIMNIWSTVPLFITTFNAAHADIPKSQYEAMEIDGAGPVYKFFKVTVPYLRPVTSYVLMMGVIGTLQMFDQAYIISKDPTIGANSDDLITTAKYIFDKAFGGNFLANDFGKASAAAIIFTSIILGFSIISSFVSKPIGAK